VPVIGQNAFTVPEKGGGGRGKKKKGRGQSAEFIIGPPNFQPLMSRGGGGGEEKEREK